MTSVHAETVRGNEAVVEIARLMSGVTVTDAALDSARELMSTVTKR
jgi:DNA repair ATPase RecN